MGFLTQVNLADIVFLKSVFQLGQLPAIEFPEIAFAGRSNVGKSSLINRLVNRITFVGALFLSAVAILPGFMQVAQRLALGPAAVGRNPALVISSAGLIIVVGVVIDTMRQLEAQLQMRHYDRFLRRFLGVCLNSQLDLVNQRMLVLQAR